MRGALDDRLHRLTADLGGMCELTCEALRLATRGLLELDLASAERVISGDRVIDAAYVDLETAACLVLALQAPVAGDLRAVVGMIQVGEKVMRMGDLAQHVAKLARMRHPLRAVPDALVEPFGEMGEHGVTICDRLRAATEDPKQLDLAELERLDDRVDELEAAVIGHVIGEGGDESGPGRTDAGSEASNAAVRIGVDVALLARFYERYADQGVAAARRLNFITTGQILRSGDPLE